MTHSVGRVQVALFLGFILLGAFVTWWSLTLGTRRIWTGIWLPVAANSSEAGIEAHDAARKPEMVPLLPMTGALDIAGLCSALWLPQLLILMNGLFSDGKKTIRQVSPSQLVCGPGFVFAYICFVFLALFVLRPEMDQIIVRFPGTAGADRVTFGVAAMDEAVYQPLRSLMALAAPLSAITSLVVSWAAGHPTGQAGADGTQEVN